jgi:hypothetical protein
MQQWDCSRSSENNSGMQSSGTATNLHDALAYRPRSTAARPQSQRACSIVVVRVQGGLVPLPLHILNTVA